MKPQDRTRAILRSSLDTGAKLVAIAITDHINLDDAEVWPSVGRLCGLTGMSERTVRDVLRSGRTAGWLAYRERPGAESAMRIVWSALGGVSERRNAGVRKGGKGRTPTPAAGAPLGETDPCAPCLSPLRPLPVTPAPLACGGGVVASEITQVRPSENACLARASEKGPRRDQEGTTSAPAPAVAPPALFPAPTPKPKKPKREPHPAHAAFGPLWDASRLAAKMGPYPWPKGGAEAGRTWRAVADVLDGHVSRDASRLDADIAAFRAAVDRYHRKPHRDFPTGHGVIGFCANASTWFDAATPGRRMTLGEQREALLAELDPPLAHPNAIDAQFSEVS